MLRSLGLATNQGTTPTNQALPRPPTKAYATSPPRNSNHMLRNTAKLRQPYAPTTKAKHCHQLTFIFAFIHLPSQLFAVGRRSSMRRPAATPFAVGHFNPRSLSPRILYVTHHHATQPRHNRQTNGRSGKPTGEGRSCNHAKAERSKLKVNVNGVSMLRRLQVCVCVCPCLRSSGSGLGLG